MRGCGMRGCGMRRCGMYHAILHGGSLPTVFTSIVANSPVRNNHSRLKTQQRACVLLTTATMSPKREGCTAGCHVPSTGMVGGAAIAAVIATAGTVRWHTRIALIAIKPELPNASQTLQVLPLVLPDPLDPEFHSRVVVAFDDINEVLLRHIVRRDAVDVQEPITGPDASVDVGRTPWHHLRHKQRPQRRVHPTCDGDPEAGGRRRTVHAHVLGRTRGRGQSVGAWHLHTLAGGR